MAAADSLTNAVTSLAKTIDKITDDQHVDPVRVKELVSILRDLNDLQISLAGPFEETSVGVT